MTAKTASPHPEPAPAPRPHTPQPDTVPTTVWICPGPAGADVALWSPAVVTQTITAFSAVGERVGFARHPQASTGRVDEGARGELDALRALARRLGRTADQAIAPAGAAPAARCRLVIAAVPPGCLDPAASLAAAGLTTPPADTASARVVVVLTGAGRDPNGALADPTGATVRALRAAGWIYVQHIVAVHVPATHILTAGFPEAGTGARMVGHDHAHQAAENPATADLAAAERDVTERAESDEPAGGWPPTARSRTRSQVRVHSDVLVFLPGDRS